MGNKGVIINLSLNPGKKSGRKIEIYNTLGETEKRRKRSTSK